MASSQDKDEERCLGAKKRARLDGTSTPPMDYRTDSRITPTSSPIYDLNRTIKSLGSSFSDGSTHSPSIVAAGLSPAIRKMFISPGNNARITEDMALLEETINLNRAALARGIIQENQQEVTISLEMNALFRDVCKRPSLCDMLENLSLGKNWTYCDIQNEMVLSTEKPKRGSMLQKVHNLREGMYSNWKTVEAYSYEQVPRDGVTSSFHER